ncbi:hypothetical protein L6452_27984 [Arctium lappa]|uniref:Uncharacterized protein n=1 Tax=Arctium lappa TaxID=4217 RepID=A0ACB8ZX87_ARCLA|nr:hypothetical protein L6452_27984 [Arctium lappa]
MEEKTCELFGSGQEHEAQQQVGGGEVDERIYGEDLTVRDIIGGSTTVYGDGGLPGFETATQFLGRLDVLESCDRHVIERTAEKTKKANETFVDCNRRDGNGVTPIVKGVGHALFGNIVEAAEVTPMVKDSNISGKSFMLSKDSVPALSFLLGTKENIKYG